MNYELTTEEKEIIAKKRLNELQTGFDRSGTNITIFQMQSGDISLTMYSKDSQDNEQAMSIAINDEDAAKIYSFLKQRYELKKEIEYLNTPLKKEARAAAGPRNGFRHGVNT